MKILVIQNRMGIGDMVIFLPFIEAISKKFNSPITLLTKENSKAKEYLSNNNHIEKIIDLKRNNNNDYHQGIVGFFRLRKDLNKFNFDKAFIFNSSARYNLVCKLAGVKEIYQYPLFKKNKQHIIGAAKSLLEKINLKIDNNPKISIEESLVIEAKRKLLTNSAEFYNLSYSYMNDCLKAGIVFRREFYTDRDIEPDNSLMFKISVIPFGEIRTPKVSK